MIDRDAVMLVVGDRIEDFLQDSFSIPTRFSILPISSRSRGFQMTKMFRNFLNDGHSCDLIHIGIAFGGSSVARNPPSRGHQESPDASPAACRGRLLHKNFSRARRSSSLSAPDRVLSRTRCIFIVAVILVNDEHLLESRPLVDHHVLAKGRFAPARWPQ